MAVRRLICFLVSLSTMSLLAMVVGSDTAAAAHSKSIVYTPDQVLKFVDEAAGVNAIPASLNSSLANAEEDQGPILASRVYGHIGSKRVSCNPSGWTQIQVPISTCVWGDRSSKKTVILMGDSHAAQWISAFDLVGKRQHWRVLLLTKSSCGAPDIGFYNPGFKTSYPACDQWHKYAINEINKIDPAVVVLASDVVYPLGPTGAVIAASTWSAGMAKTLDAIDAPGIKKVVLGDEPRVGSPNLGGPVCLAEHESSVQDCSTPTSAATEHGLYEADQQGAQQGGATYINVIPWFCSATCTAVVDNINVYADWSHITTQYAEFLSGALQQSLSQATGLNL